MTLNKKLFFAPVLAGLTLLVSPVHAADYNVDTKGAHAAITFKFKHLGISWLTGEFTDFDGTFSFDADDLEASNVNINIRTASIDSNHAERDRHIRSDDFLDTDKFPDASFTSTKIAENSDGTLAVTGNLTLHGMTNEITIQASKTGEGKDPWGGYRVGLEGTTTLDTMAFGMKFPPTNEVIMNLYLEGIRK